MTIGQKSEARGGCVAGQRKKSDEVARGVLWKKREGVGGLGKKNTFFPKPWPRGGPLAQDDRYEKAKKYAKRILIIG